MFGFFFARSPKIGACLWPSSPGNYFLRLTEPDLDEDEPRDEPIEREPEPEEPILEEPDLEEPILGPEPLR